MLILAFIQEKAIIACAIFLFSARIFVMSQPLTVLPGDQVRLKDFDSSYTGGIKNKKDAQAELDDNIKTLSDLGYRLYAEDRRSLLLVLQGMDTSGKDGAIRHVTTGFNPQSCQVTSFKQPSIEELDHDFLWRIARAMPRKGHIGIFNRSHYEDVLIVRVHNLVPKSEWHTRYDRINLFEKMAYQGGITLVKVFLHISKEEQRKRLQARLDDPQKRWKFSKADLAEREYWNDYQKAYNEAISRCNTEHAPWHIVPADKKWYRNLILSRILRQTLEKLDPQFPPAEEGLADIIVK
jgi:PPK2 family polyphosphate:nucleotide phosphotransferase